MHFYLLIDLLIYLFISTGTERTASSLPALIHIHTHAFVFIDIVSCLYVLVQANRYYLKKSLPALIRIHTHAFLLINFIIDLYLLV